MKVTEVLATTAVIPLRNVTSSSTRTVSERHYTIVRVRTDEEHEGLGFCYCGNGAGWVVTTRIRDLLAPHIVGRDPHDAEAIWETMYRDALLMGRRGAVLRAMSALDIALWDVCAKAAELPLYRYLGSPPRETVSAYASGGYYLDGKTPEHLADECAGYVEMGFQAVKIKVGRVSAREDAQRIAAVRQAIGDDVEFFTDANNAWDDATSAIRAIRQCGTIVHVPYGPKDASTLHLDEEFHVNRPTIVGSQAVWQNPDRSHPLWDEARARQTAADLFRRGMLSSQGIVTPVVAFRAAIQELADGMAGPSRAIKIGVHVP